MFRVTHSENLSGMVFQTEFVYKYEISNGVHVVVVSLSFKYKAFSFLFSLSLSLSLSLSNHKIYTIIGKVGTF